MVQLRFGEFLGGAQMLPVEAFNTLVLGQIGSGSVVTVATGTQWVLRDPATGYRLSINGAFSYDGSGLVFGNSPINSLSVIDASDRVVVSFSGFAATNIGAVLSNQPSVWLTGFAFETYEIFGTESGDLLRTLSGSSILRGGGGNDTYSVENTTSSIFDTGGIDLVRLSFAGAAAPPPTGFPIDPPVIPSQPQLSQPAYVLLPDFENAELLAGAWAVTGNALDNQITVVEYAAGGFPSTGVTVRGAAGRDTLIGGSRNDWLFGDADADTLIGGGGSDVLDGGSGADRMEGGTGSDTYVVDSVDDVVIDNDRFDRVVADISYTLSGSIGELYLSGSRAIDGTGNDAGNTMYGNVAANRLSGGRGSDYINGGDGDDVVAGDEGDDFLLGADGNDAVSGGDGRDQLSGGAGSDTLDGGLNDDVIEGGDGNDTLIGGDGNDQLNGNAGSDWLDGGLGDDQYTIDGSDVIATDPGGVDTVITTASITLRADLENVVLSGSAVRFAIGNESANRILGDSLPFGSSGVVLTGLGGNDSLTGAEGPDLLDGGIGDDTLIGGYGADTLIGGEGNDRLTGGSLTAVLDGGAGNDTISSDSSLGTILAGDGNDKIILPSGAQAPIEGGNGDDSLWARYGAVTFRGGPGMDVLTKGYTVGDDSADDFFDGGPGVDMLSANGGNDTYVVDGDYALAGNAFLAMGFFNGSQSADTLLFEPATPADIRTQATDRNLDGQIDTLKIWLGDGSTAPVIQISTLHFGLNAGPGGPLVPGLRGAASSNLGLSVAPLELTFFNSGYLGYIDLRDIAFANDGVTVTRLDLQVSQQYGGFNALGALGIVRIGQPTPFVLTDEIIELAGGGIDTVRSARSYTLAAELERLELTGTDPVSGMGNAAGNALFGNTGANRLTGLAGSDTIDGGAGDDLIVATHDDGNDSLTGGGGFDIVDYSAVNGPVQIDQLAGVTTGSAGNDVLLDVIEQITGTAYSDVLSGGHGINVLDGMGGNDQFFGNRGDDLMRGGDGDDTFYFSNSDGDDRLLGDAGFDILDYSSLDGVVQVNQLAGTTTGTAGNDTLLDVFEMVIGTAFGDVLSGGHGINSLKGGGGNDTIFANNGDDYVSGGAGNDLIVFGPGNDTLDFRNGEGIDTITDFVAGAGSDDTITLKFYSGLGTATLAGLQGAGRIVQNGADTQITLNGGDALILQNVVAANLHADDFIFT